MGADLIVTAQWQKCGTELNWNAGVEAVDSLSREELDAFADSTGDFDDTATDVEIRGRAVQLVAELRDAIVMYDDPEKYGPRDLTTLVTPDGQYRVFLSGGMSWGDSPTETYDLLGDLWDLPSVMRAIGFESKQPESGGA